MYDDKIKDRARELRRQGFTRIDIIKMLEDEIGAKVAVRTLDYWCNDIKTTITKSRIKKEVKQETVRNNDGTITSSKDIEITDDDLNDDMSLLLKHGYDPKQFKVVNARHTEWDGILKGGTSPTKMHAHKLTVEKIKGSLPSSVFEEIAELFKNPITNDKIEYDLGNVYRVINIRDLHLGLLSWIEEVGGNYDHKIASKLFNSCVDKFIQEMKEKGDTKRIILLTGDDFLHFDTIHSTTTKGTYQDSDVRWQKMFKLGTVLLKENIEKLAEIAPVEVPFISGNHDTQASFYMQEVLAAWFQDDERIDIDTKPETRKYKQLGNTLLGVSHGNMPKNNLYQVMPKEAWKLWGQCKYKEFHIGHLHTEKTEENGGVIYRWMPTLCGASAWEHNSGYASKSASFMYSYDEEYGLTNISVFTPDMIKDNELKKEIGLE